MDQAFKIMKTKMAAYVLMEYPNHNIPFHKYTGISDYQMGTFVIHQNIKPNIITVHKRINVSQL